MEWKTKISKSSTKETLIRGYELEQMVKKLSFSEAIFLILSGEKPTKNQAQMLDAIFVSSIDHGMNTASVMATRSVASTGNELNVAVSSGVAALGKYHGGAIDKCAEILQRKETAKEIVEDALANRKVLSGYGHKMYKDVDPRAKQLLDLAKKLKIAGDNVKKLKDIEKQIEKQKGKKIIINIDGAIAAIILDMGFPASLGKAFFTIARTPGLCAHAHEELTEEKPVRRLEDTSYKGPKKRKL